MNDVIRRCTRYLAILGSVIWLHCYAEPYQSFNADDILTMGEQTDESSNVNFSKQALDQAVAQLWVHARNYPLQFDSDAQRNIAGQDIRKLRLLVPFLREKILPYTNDVQVIEHVKLLEARLAVMAYNFDEVEALHVADALYQSLIAETHDKNMRAFYQQDFGQFLAMSARGEQAQPYLQAALDGGRKQALKSLGLLELSDLDREQALIYLSRYLAVYPDDEEAKALVKMLSDPDTEITVKHQ